MRSGEQDPATISGVARASDIGNPLVSVLALLLMHLAFAVAARFRPGSVTEAVQNFG